MRNFGPMLYWYQYVQYQVKAFWGQATLLQLEFNQLKIFAQCFDYSVPDIIKRNQKRNKK